jgi:hypothetical protein
MKKHYEDDDGRVIASMDEEALRPRRTPARVQADSLKPKTDATRKEAWHIAANATLAALFIGFVIMAVIALVVLILTMIW